MGEGEWGVVWERLGKSLRKKLLFLVEGHSLASCLS